MKRPGRGNQREIVAALASFVFALTLSTRAFAQTCVTGKLRVLVQDTNGTSMSGVEVRLANGSSLPLTGVTDAQGVLEFENLVCGAWIVTAAKNTFHQLSDANFQITAAASAELAVAIGSLEIKDSVDVHDSAPPLEGGSSQHQELSREEVKSLPFRPVTVTDALPLVPGVTRSPDGEIKIDGSGEQRSAFVVNQADVTDPATGKFGQTVPIDSVQTLAVLNTPFVAQYGNFTSGVVAVQTRRAGEKWHAELNDPLPGFRFRSWHMRGIRDSTPRALFGGPIVQHRLYFMNAVQYGLMKKPERTLPFPFNESKQESVNSFSQLDYIVSSRQMLTASIHVSPQHTNFVNPEYFNPQPVTPNHSQHNYLATVTDRLELRGGTLDSTISVQRFDARVGSQGAAEMMLTPLGNRGNYFSTLRRDAGRDQWLEVWSPPQISHAGKHDVKLGGSVTVLTNNGERWARPINILDAGGLLLRRIEFTGGSPFHLTDSEVAAFAQDHWFITPRLTLDTGARIERQNISRSMRLAPRTGLSWAPFSSGSTVIRAGYGVFFDRVPLGVYTFGRMPQRIVTDYAPDGSIVGEPVSNSNVIGASAAHSILVYNGHMPGNFAPRSSIWNAQIEQRVSRLLLIRAIYTHSRSGGLVVLEPQAVDVSQFTLMGGGRSRYRQLEITGRLQWAGQQLFLAYTHSHAEGHLGDFSNFLGNFPVPLIRPNVYSNLPGDLPNRFLAWGSVNLFWKTQLLPMLEYRNGFPYAPVNALGDYVGMPFGDHARFPNFFAADARIQKDIRVDPKYTLRFSVSGFNLTNHFNALSVHANIADPQYGVFFGNYHLRYRADFDVLF